MRRCGGVFMFSQLLQADVPLDDKKVFNYQFSRVHSQRCRYDPRGQLKWMQGIELRESVWMLCCLLPRAQLNCALEHCLSVEPGPSPAIHLQRNSELVGNTKVEARPNGGLSSSDANDIQNGRKRSFSVGLCEGFYARTQLLCGVFNLSTPGSPKAPSGIC